jgi:hypothetical protein
MTPKEKAIELVDMMGMYTSTSFNHINGKNEPIYRNPYAKQCALIAVDEIWNALESARVFEEYDYWQEVKKEINEL